MQRYHIPLEIISYNIHILFTGIGYRDICIFYSILPIKININFLHWYNNQFRSFLVFFYFLFMDFIYQKGLLLFFLVDKIWSSNLINRFNM